MTNTLSMDKQLLMERAKDRELTGLEEGTWSTKEKVALTCRILFANGHDSGLAGQITARVENGQGYYTQRLGLGFDEIRPDNLLLVDEDLEVMGGEGVPNPANRFHTWIYRKRTDVHCIIHTHGLHLSTLSMLEKPLIVSHMDSCMLYDDVAFLTQWPGVPVGNEEGKLISEALGDKRALLLAHHGIVVACRSVEEACVLALQCERTARMQLLAETVGEIQAIDPVLAQEAHDWVLQEKRIKAGFSYYARRTLAAADFKDFNKS